MGEPTRRDTECEVVKLRDKMEQARIDIARLQEQGKASDRALGLADNVLAEWKRGTNEWRQENLDQRNLFPTKERVDGLVDSVNKRVDALDKQGARLSGAWAVVVFLWPIIVGIVVGVVVYVVTHK